MNKKLQVQKFVFKATKKKTNKVILGEDFDLFVKYTLDSKTLYNFILYLVRQKFFMQEGKETDVFERMKEFKTNLVLYDLLINYLQSGHLFCNELSLIACRYAEQKELSFNTKVSQYIYKQVKDNFTSFYKLCVAKKVGRVTGPVKIPGYKRNEYNKVILSKQVTSKKLLKTGYVGTTGCKQGLKLNSSKINIDNLQAVELNYKHDCLVISVIYQIPDYTVKTVEDIDLKDKKLRVAGLDPGVDNLFTVAFNFNQRPINIHNGYLKSVNQWYNKEVSRLKSELPKGNYSSKKIRTITRKRNETILNKSNNYVNNLVTIFDDLKIDVVIVGKNLNWKQEAFSQIKNRELRAKLNQNFVEMPIAKIVERLKYKLGKKGIVVIMQEESYTSKASFLNDDFIPTYQAGVTTKYNFSGYRTGKSYKVTGENKWIHADVNGAYNIIRKAGFTIEKGLIVCLKAGKINPIGLEAYLCKRKQEVKKGLDGSYSGI